MEYHVGCGITAIYAGVLNKNKDMWLRKSDVTDEAFVAVAQYCIVHNEELTFEYKGKKYILSVSEDKAESEE
jgi:hypothetical protein